MKRKKQKAIRKSYTKMCHVLRKQFVQSFKLRFQSFAFNIKMMLELEDKETYTFTSPCIKKKKKIAACPSPFVAE